MEKLDFFPLYPSDFFGDNNVAVMNGIEQGVYILLLMRVWGTKDQYKIPNDDVLISKLLSLSLEEWMRCKKPIMNCLFEQDGFLISCRLKKEKEKADRLYDHAIKMNEKRWHPNRISSQDVPTGLLHRSPNQNQNKNQNKKKKNIYGESVFGLNPDPEKMKYLDATYLSEKEYAKLQEKLGAMAWKCIEKLDSYKMAHRKHYDSDYHAILNWVVNKVTEEETKTPKMTSTGAIPPKTKFKPAATDVPGSWCSRCNEAKETVEHRGSEYCAECLKIVNPEIPDQLSGLLKNIGRKMK